MESDVEPGSFTRTNQLCTTLERVLTTAMPHATHSAPSSRNPLHHLFWNRIKLNLPFLQSGGVSLQLHSRLMQVLPGHAQCCRGSSWPEIGLRHSQRGAGHHCVVPHPFHPHLKGLCDSRHMRRRAISTVCSQLALLHMQIRPLHIKILLCTWSAPGGYTAFMHTAAACLMGSAW